MQLHHKSSRWVLFPRCKVPTTHAVVSMAVKSNRSPNIFPQGCGTCSAAQNKNFLKQSAEHLYTASVYRKAQLILQNPPSEAQLIRENNSDLKQKNQKLIRKPTDSIQKSALLAIYITGISKMQNLELSGDGWDRHPLWMLRNSQV